MEKDLHTPLGGLTYTQYGFLSFGLAAGFLILQIYIPVFYAETFGISLALIGTGLFLVRIIDTFADPLVGFLSDRTSDRPGGLKKWVIWGAPALALSLFALTHPPEGSGLLYLLVTSAAVYVSGTAIIIPYYAIGASITKTYQQRSKISGIRAAFGLTGTITALILPYIFLSPSEAEQVAGAAGAQPSLGPSTSLLGAVSAACLMAGMLAILPLKVPHAARIETPSFRQIKRLFTRATPLRQLIVSYLLNGIANGIPASLFLLYVTYKLGARDMAGPLLAAYFIMAALSVPVWVRLSGRFGKDKVWQAAMLGVCFVFIWAPFLQEGDVALFFFITLLTGFATGADLVLPAAMQADLIDWDTARQNRSRAGLFFAMWGMATKLGYALAALISFPLLTLAGFDGAVFQTTSDAARTNSSEGLWALGLIYGFLPVLLKLGSIYVIRGYPLSASRHAKVRAKLAHMQL